MSKWREGENDRRDVSRPDSEERRKTTEEDSQRAHTEKFIGTDTRATLAEELKLLDTPGGLNILHAKYCVKK